MKRFISHELTCKEEWLLASAVAAHLLQRPPLIHWVLSTLASSRWAETTLDSVIHTVWFVAVVAVPPREAEPTMPCYNREQLYKNVLKTFSMHNFFEIHEPWTHHCMHDSTLVHLGLVRQVAL